MISTAFRSLRQLYSVETLDTRFTVDTAVRKNSNEIQLADASAPGSPDPRPAPATGPGREASPSRWKTAEFRFYYFMVMLVIPFMIKQVVDVSLASNQHFPQVSRYLSRGWIPGRRVDNSDNQFATFRNNFPSLLVVAVVHIALRRVCAPVFARLVSRKDFRLRFDLAFGLFYILVLHGSSIIKIATIVSLNYAIVKRVPPKYRVVATWVFGVGVLFTNEFWGAYDYKTALRTIFGYPAGTDGYPFQSLATVLDQYPGLIKRWGILFKFSILRLISFNIDYSESLDNPPKELAKPGLAPDVKRVREPADPNDYTLANLFSYVLYVPLYLAGPIVTFNDYIAQCRVQPRSITFSRNVMYAIRFGIAYLSMELFIHYVYIAAILRVKPDWDTYTPFQLGMLAFFNLIHIWLKLLLPWRFFRAWALLDGVDSPENMVRCMSNNYSTLAFWRGWHWSYSLWTIRYLYVPLGGSRQGTVRSVANYAVVFTFVAIWHDINLQLLMWGSLIILFVLPEIIAMKLFPASDWKQSPNIYRAMCGAGAVINVAMMVFANLVGFGVGMESASDLFAAIARSPDGPQFMFSAFTCLFMGCQLMFEVREDEIRRGLKIRC